MHCYSTNHKTHEEQLHVILDYCAMLSLYPTTVLIDFEQSVICALQAVLGVRGCFYHLTHKPPGERFKS